MTGLIEMDVTKARALLAAPGREPLSTTAYLVACLARAVQRNPEVHGYRDWRGRIVVHHFVDVTVLVEVPTSARPIAFPRVLRNAQSRSVADLTAELRMAKGEPFVQVIGGRFREDACLTVAAAIESAFPMPTPIDPASRSERRSPASVSR